MTLRLNISADSGLTVSVNGKTKNYFDGSFTLKNIPCGSTVQISQIQLRRRWFLLPFYIIEGLLTLIFNFSDEIFSFEYIHPYIYKCSFRINGDDSCELSVSSQLSKIDRNGKLISGYINVSGAEILDCSIEKELNEYTFRYALIRIVYACISVPVLINGLLVLLSIMSDGFSWLGAIVIGGVLAVVYFIVILKIIEEKKRIGAIRSRFCEKQDE